MKKTILRAVLSAWVLFGISLAGSLNSSDLSGGPRPDETFRTLTGELRKGDDVELFLLELMKTSHIPTLSVAVVQDDRTVFGRILGVVDRKTGKPADSRTVLRAASLSKPVFSYLVMRLADEGLLALDQPLADFIDPPFTSYREYASLKDDARFRELTAAILLTHSAGFPNWRRPRWIGPLTFHFDPGKDFSYSGEGYYLLQFLLEKKTGRDLNALAKEKIFDPLGMGRSSFLWEDRFDGDFAVDLDAGLGRLIRRTRTQANSAASLLTNASDYAQFMLAALSGRGLKPETAAAWRTPRLRVTGKVLHDRNKPDTTLNEDIQLSWTPGWGRFRSPAGEALFHVGMEEGCENYAVLFPEKKTGIVIQSVSDLSVRISPSIVKQVIGDVYSPFTWMRY
ncbi:MAG: beta-lactamase family protein [Candidatus Aminicenantes bacterium]|nr:beta-lactamase family protein [Candidatus Aminicenantes bacterium]